MTSDGFLNSFATALLVAFGGAVGAILRFGCRQGGLALGWAGWVDTLLVNVVGSFLIGWLFVQLEARFRTGGSSRLAPTPHFPKLQAHGWLLGPDPTLDGVELFRADLRLRFLSGVLLTGVLGGFTTFSTFALETVMLWRDEQTLFAALNLALSLTLPIAATAVGLWSAERGLRSAAGRAL